jgi:cysteine desulfurase
MVRPPAATLMLHLPIYMDNHATTRLDPRVLEAMLPYFSDTFGNPGSTTHSFGRAANDAVDAAREQVAVAIGAKSNEVVFTSGATESNNLAIRGVAERQPRKGRHLLSVTTEHPAVLDPLKKLAPRGLEVTLLPVVQSPDDRAGLITVGQVAEAIRDDTMLVSIMLANNEIGAVPSMAEIGRLCRERGVLLHTDATQAVGKIPVDVQQLQVDLMSFTAHKIYGPKGIGALYVRRRAPQVRLEPLIDGGGQQWGLRSGTLNVPGIVGFARALQLCLEDLPGESTRLRRMRDRLFAGLKSGIAELSLNGPALDLLGSRLPGNLNVQFPGVAGETLLIHMPELALSSGSACTSANPEPSHVLRSLGLSEMAASSSVRFGLGRFNTEEEVDYAIRRVADAVAKLRSMSRPTG